VYEPAIVTNATSLALPARVEWHSGIVFTNLNTNWHAIYLRSTNVVVAERKFGHGSVVIATDSFFVSNEALTRDRQAQFLAWLVGSGRTVYFDEAHLGVAETSGIGVLMRKYRLHGLAFGLALLAAMFVWKNSVSLVPPHQDEQPDGFISGKNAAAG